MKKFFDEFKKFITRGNVLDLAVGVIVGGAFTAIVTALTTYILQPLINWLIAAISGGSKALESAVTVLQGSYDANGEIVLADSIYINWGALISAIINFILVAFILFCIVKVVNNLSDGNNKLMGKVKKSSLTAEEIKEMQEKGLDFKKKQDRIKYKEEKLALLKQQEEAEKEKKKLEEEEAKKHTTEYLLEEIKDILKEQNKK